MEIRKVLLDLDFLIANWYNFSCVHLPQSGLALLLLSFRRHSESYTQADVGTEVDKTLLQNFP